jgi:hypothetical protein
MGKVLWGSQCWPQPRFRRPGRLKDGCRHECPPHKNMPSCPTGRTGHKEPGREELVVKAMGHESFNNWRAITSRWISLVPSPMVHSFTSR